MPAGPLAVWPVVFAQTWLADGVIVGVAGPFVIGTVTVFVAVQPEAFVTSSVRSTVPEGPAV